MLMPGNRIRMHVCRPRLLSMFLPSSHCSGVPRAGSLREYQHPETEAVTVIICRHDDTVISLCNCHSDSGQGPDGAHHLMLVVGNGSNSVGRLPPRQVAGTLLR